jgi:hypothetical protein
LSHTSGCEKEPADPDDAQAYRFISAMDSGLMAEAAQAQGPRVTALASLMGCDEGARSGFVELMRMRFDTIYPDAWPRPDVVLNTLRVEMEHDAVLATCRPGMLFTEPSLTP